MVESRIVFPLLRIGSNQPQQLEFVLMISQYFEELLMILQHLLPPPQTLGILFYIAGDVLQVPPQLLLDVLPPGGVLRELRESLQLGIYQLLLNRMVFIQSPIHAGLKEVLGFLQVVRYLVQSLKV